MTNYRRNQDHYGRKAKADGFPARSVYKLDEIDRRLKLLRPGMRVLDLGASPGSWTMYAAQRVGPSGRVLGLDLHPHRGALPKNAEIRVLDAFQASVEELGGAASYDVVLSDMAPKTTGHRSVDQARSQALFEHALDVAVAVLRPGGHFVGKIFQGPDFELARKKVAEHFEECRIVRPDATRDISYEIFLAGLRLRKVTPPST